MNYKNKKGNCDFLSQFFFVVEKILKTERYKLNLIFYIYIFIHI